MALKRRNRVEAGFAMSSMTDLVFLLLLFFVMASTMSSPNDIKINLPTSRAQKATRPQVAKVSIDNLGNYFVALGKEKPVAIDPESLEASKRRTLRCISRCMPMRMWHIKKWFVCSISPMSII